MLFLKTHDYFLPGKPSVRVISRLAYWPGWFLIPTLTLLDSLCIYKTIITDEGLDIAWPARLANPLGATGNGRVTGSATRGDANQAAWLMVDLAELRQSLGVEVWGWHCFLQSKMWNVIISEANKASSTRNKQTKSKQTTATTKTPEIKKAKQEIPFCDFLKIWIASFILLTWLFTCEAKYVVHDLM